MKSINIILLLLLSSKLWSQAANNNCASATSLTLGAALTCGQTTENATLQASECVTAYAGASEETVWYRIDATNDSLVLNFVVTNTDDCPPHIRVYGPFADGAGCTPGCASAVYSALQNGDPGSHILLTGLTTTAGSNDYLVQIQGNSCGGPADGFTEFCISAASPATNSTAANATLIDECGTAFTNTTNGGYFQAGTSTGFNNLDGNNTTTCGTCGEAGDDTPFVINNVSWSTFCSLTAGTWQITVNGISGCTLASPNQGIQASVFTGTSGALTNQGNSASPLAPGASYTSPTITVNAGQCAFLMIDGFAGDACNYSVTLTNITGGCVILPLEFVGLNVYRSGTDINLSWEILSETDNANFLIESSTNGSDFSYVTMVPGIGNHSFSHTYYASDRRPETSEIYYKLSSIDNDGDTTILAVKYVKGEIDSNPDYFKIYPNPATTSVNVELNFPMAEANASVEIFSLSGALLQKTNYAVKNGFNSLSVNTTDLEDGTYMVRITTPYKVYTEKILIQKN